MRGDSGLKGSRFGQLPKHSKRSMERPFRKLELSECPQAAQARQEPLCKGTEGRTLNSMRDESMSGQLLICKHRESAYVKKGALPIDRLISS
jgi:hypothetical protein